ncbi:MAG: ATP-binding protein [Tepidisphaeraceae bacterium]
MSDDLDTLRRTVQERDQTIAALSAELAETNQGVLALYAELDDRATQLRDASDLKSRFLSYMSHEFRTPLGSIQSIARILLDRMDGALTPEQEKQIGFIQASAVELNEMVNDLLDLAKVEAGRVTVSPAWFEMVDLFAALRGMFRPLLSNNAVTLNFIEPSSPLRIYTDDRRLSQILRNFISNALKFTHKGEVRVTADVNGDCVTFSVADTGVGIAPEHLNAIFHDWVQLDSPLQKRLRGSGLGLSLSKRLAELLGGSVSVKSELGVGSTFSVTVPCRLPGHEPNELKTSDERKAGGAP